MRRFGTKVQAHVDEVVTVLLPASGILLADSNPLIIGGEAVVACNEGHPDRNVWTGR